MEEDVFEVGFIHHRAQLTRSPLNIADYRKIKFNNDVVQSVRKMAKSIFKYPDKPESKYKSDRVGNPLRGNSMIRKFYVEKEMGKGQ